jgi:hypothetical protein
VRNCIDGFVQIHAAGFGARKPATSITAGSSALVEVRHFEGSTPAAAAADGVLAAGAGAAAGVEAGVEAASVGTIGAGGRGAGRSPHEASNIDAIAAAPAIDRLRRAGVDSRPCGESRGFMGP